MKQFQKVAVLLVPFYTLFISVESYALIPDKGEIFEILRANDVNIRRGSQYGPAQKGALFSIGESLHFPGSGNSFAKLRFQKNGRDMGLQVGANSKNQLTTLYYFPCTLRQGDSSIIEWANQPGGKRACEQGIRVQRGNNQKANLIDDSYYASLQTKQLIAQSPRARMEYCTIQADDGRGWFSVASGGDDPCEEPIKQCQASGGKNCEAYTRDTWSLKAQNVTATVKCANDKKFSEKATGATVQDTLTKLWQTAQSQKAKSCGAHIVDHQFSEIIVAPLSSGYNLFQTRNTADGIEVEVIEGQASVISSQKPLGIVINAGQKYSYTGITQQDKIDNFDRNTESIERQIFFAEKNGFKLCDQEQVSGGQQGDSREIQLTANEGKIRINYDMFDIPDKLKVTYEGKNLVDTGFVSRTNSIEVPFKGNSGRVKVEVIGNETISTTQWKYTLYCP
jgi:hypothetical protein